MHINGEESWMKLEGIVPTGGRRPEIRCRRSFCGIRLVRGKVARLLQLAESNNTTVSSLTNVLRV